MVRVECGSEDANGHLSSIYLLSFPLIYLCIYLYGSDGTNGALCSIHLSIHPYIYFFIHTSISLSIHLFIYPYIYLFIYSYYIGCRQS